MLLSVPEEESSSEVPALPPVVVPLLVPDGEPSGKKLMSGDLPAPG